MAKTKQPVTIVSPEQPKVIQGLSVAEQEFHISWRRDEDFARIYASDTTQMTRLDKLCKANPDMYILEQETPYGKIYRCNDKSLISLRTKKREISEEQKEAASQRFKDMWASKDVQMS